MCHKNRKDAASSPRTTCYQHPVAYPDVDRGCQPSQKGGPSDQGSSHPTTQENNSHLIWKNHDTDIKQQLEQAGGYRLYPNNIYFTTSGSLLQHNCVK